MVKTFEVRVANGAELKLLADKVRVLPSGALELQSNDWRGTYGRTVLAPGYWHQFKELVHPKETRRALGDAQ